jgi:ssDNA-binding Zn-finger/Zn-ribbon topoisomerase 1
MKPCPCRGANEACYFCGGKGFVTDAPPPPSAPREKPRNGHRQAAQPRNQSVVATNTAPRLNAAQPARKTSEGLKRQCPGCRVMMTKQAFNAHLAACPRTFLYETCTSCSRLVLRSKILEHAKSCPNRRHRNRPALPPKFTKPSTAQDKRQLKQPCPRCGALVVRLKKHLRKVHKVQTVKAHSASSIPSDVLLGHVQTGRLFVVGRTLPLKKASASEPNKAVVRTKNRSKGKRTHEDVFDLPARLLHYGGAFDSNRRRH